MKKYQCIMCGYVYNPEKGDPVGGVEPHTEFADLPEDWVCPICREGKAAFEEYQWNHLDLDNLKL